MSGFRAVTFFGYIQFEFWDGKLTGWTDDASRSPMYGEGSTDEAVDLWWGDARGVRLDASTYDTLSDAERERLARFRFGADRETYAAAHATLRLVLSRYAAVEPRCWRFLENRHGRPEVAAPASGRRLRFSLSHSRGVFAIAVARDLEVGIDVERLGARRLPMRLAGHILSPAEQADLDALPQRDRERRLVEYWTLKEAYLKARGVGLSVSPTRVPFRFRERGRIELESGEDDSAAWQFSLPKLRPDLVAALAVEVLPGSCAPRVQIL